jgi:hypothetical protein
MYKKNYLIHNDKAAFIYLSELLWTGPNPRGTCSRTLQSILGTDRPPCRPGRDCRAAPAAPAPGSADRSPASAAGRSRRSGGGSLRPSVLAGRLLLLLCHPPRFPGRNQLFQTTCLTAGKNNLNEEITSLLPNGIGERCSQTISNLGHAALLRRCELPL